MKSGYGQGDEPPAGPGKSGGRGGKQRLMMAGRVDGPRRDVPAGTVRELCLDEHTWPGRWLLLNAWLAVAAGWALGIAVADGIGYLFSRRD